MLGDRTRNARSCASSPTTPASQALLLPPMSQPRRSYCQCVTATTIPGTCASMAATWSSIYAENCTARQQTADSQTTDGDLKGERQSPVCCLTVCCLSSQFPP